MFLSSRLRAHPRAAWLVLVALGVVALGVAGRRAAVPLDADRLVQRGEAQLQDGEAAAALGTFREVTRIAPADPRGYDGLARALQSQAGFPHSDSEAQAWVAAQESVITRVRHERWSLDGRAVVLRNHGFACFRLGEFARALPSLQELHASGAGSLETELALAVAAQSCGRAEVAQAALRTARARYGNIEPVWKLGLALRSACGPWSAAEMAGLRNLKPLVPVPEPRDPCSVHLAAEDDRAAGRFVEAESKWASLLAGPQASLAELGLGRIALQREAPDVALRHFGAAAADSALPRETACYWRAQALTRQGDFAAARAALQEGLAANPLAERDAALCGFVETAAGDTAAAIATYQRMLDLDRRDPEALYRLGMLWLGTPRREEARALLQKYLDAQPEGAHAGEVRRLLHGE